MRFGALRFLLVNWVTVAVGLPVAVNDLGAQIDVPDEPCDVTCVNPEPPNCKWVVNRQCSWCILDIVPWPRRGQKYGWEGFWAQKYVCNGKVISSEWTWRGCGFCQ
jgi:hypothetical protein